MRFAFAALAASHGVATGIVLLATSVGSATAAATLDPSGVVALLDVMDAIAALHPDFGTRMAVLEGASESVRAAACSEARARNESNALVRDRLDALFETSTYRLYFRRFHNVTAELVREILLDLPYRTRPSPGGIAETYQHLLSERRMLRAWVDELVKTIDLEVVEAKALRWVPAGAPPIPTVHLIYDSNAGSFTADGKPFFNLYSERSQAEHPDESTGENFTAYAEGVMAHEIQHALAKPILYPKGAKSLRSWQERWADRLVRGLVSEGVAAHCNPPAGIRARIWEDAEVLQSLVQGLNDILHAMRSGSADEADVERWYQDNFQATAHELLRRFLARDYSGDELQSRLQRYASIRPDSEHVLGWWMVSRVSRNGTDREAALQLLRDPGSLLSRYNHALGEGETALRVADDIAGWVEETVR